MSEFPSVATVLLVAVEARQRVLAPWLRVVGEPVRYALETAEPDVVPAGGFWDVVVIDGESVRGDERRERLLMDARERCGIAPVLYLQRRRLSPAEDSLAFAWADDSINQGEDFEQQLRRRVQSIALAPWRRATALRMEAERLGDRRLRVVRPARAAADEDPSSGIDRAAPELVASTFPEGRRVHVALLRNAAGHCQTLLDELNQALETLPSEFVRELSASGSESGSPIAAARFGARFAITSVRCELWRLVHEELAAMERQDARPVSEP